MFNINNSDVISIEDTW